MWEKIKPITLIMSVSTYLLIVVLFICSGEQICEIQNLIESISKYPLISIALLCIVLFFYTNITIFSNMYCMLFSVFFSIMFTVGFCMINSNSLFMNFVIIVVFMGTLSCSYAMTMFLFKWLDRESLPKVNDRTNFNKLYWAILIIGIWIPLLLIFYPGRVGGDAGWAINCFINHQISDRHPVLYTYIVGGVFSFSRKYVGGNGGIFINVFMQMILVICTIIYMIEYIFSRNIRYKFKYIWSGFLILNPIIFMYAITLQTDTYYACFFALALIYMLKMINNEIQYSIQLQVIILAFFMICASLFRKEGIWILGATSIVLIINSKFKRKIFFISACCFIVGTIISSKISAMGIQIEGHDEIYKYSVLLQGTSRYVCEYEAELSEEEKKTIDKIVEYDKIKENYNPILSDKIMAIYRMDSSKQEKHEFIKLYFRLLNRHPICFLNAFLNNCYGYFYLGQNYDNTVVSGISKDVISDPEQQYYYEWYGWKHINLFKVGIDILDRISNKLQYIPLLGLIFIPSFYVWGTIIIGVYVLYSKKYKLIAPIFMNVCVIAVCMISPANGHLRYVFPLIVTMPILAVSFKTQIVDEG